MVYVTAIHLDGGVQHQHIAAVKWRNPQTAAIGASTRAEMVTFIRAKGGQVYVTDGSNTIPVGVVDASPPFIRTYADGKWTDNLLALPTY